MASGRLTHGASPFTAREGDILDAIAHGLSCREIGAALGISESTVRKHRSNMLAKVGAHNAAGLVVVARLRGWLRQPQGPPGRSSALRA
ncbi:MAG TPA: LuxR C-terminal-related transcriptional regulator [Roseateles sp.]|nr:LuxR C-terminal-related transcriptional regulator [Roseateles sp.]